MPAEVAPAVAADIVSPAVSGRSPRAPVTEAEALTGEAVSGPWAPSDAAPKAAEPAEPAAAAKAARQSDVETALGTRWAVWVGGIALALGGLFLIRYTIEAGIFGPGVRLSMAAVLGLVLVAGGEFIRRTGFKVPVQGAAGAYIPAILTAAGAFILFGTVYAAHGVYGFIGPALAFTLLGAIGVATMQPPSPWRALAGIGLIGAMVADAGYSQAQSQALFVSRSFLPHRRHRPHARLDVADGGGLLAPVSGPSLHDRCAARPLHHPVHRRRHAGRACVCLAQPPWQ